MERSIATVEMFIETLWASDNTRLLFIVQEGRADAETEHPHTVPTTSREVERISPGTFNNIDPCESWKSLDLHSNYPLYK